MFLCEALLETAGGLHHHNQLVKESNTWGGWNIAVRELMNKLDKDFGPILIKTIRIAWIPEEQS